MLIGETQSLFLLKVSMFWLSRHEETIANRLFVLSSEIDVPRIILFIYKMAYTIGPSLSQYLVRLSFFAIIGRSKNGSRSLVQKYIDRRPIVVQKLKSKPRTKPKAPLGATLPQRQTVELLPLGQNDRKAIFRIKCRKTFLEK